MTIYTYPQLVGFAQNAGFQGQSAYTAAGIAMAESSGNPNAIAYNDGGKGYNSYGLMQINGVNDAAVGGAQNALDPQTSFNQAYILSNGGSNFSPWSTYNSGAYSQYVNPNITPEYVGGGSANNYGLGDPNLNQLNDPAYLTGMPTYGDTTASDTTGLPYGGTGTEMAGVYGTTANGLQNEGYYGGSLHVNVSPQPTTATVVGGTGQPGSLTNTGVLGGLSGATGAGTPVQLNLGAGTVQDITKWITAPITAFEKWAAAAAEQGINWFERGFLIFLAIVIIFVALWRLSSERGGGRTTIVPIPA